MKRNSEAERLKDLGYYYRGARMEGETFIVCFAKKAMHYLNSSVVYQTVVKGALEGSIKKNFPEIQQVDYEIDGKIMNEWDV